jgi:indolepyruvate ferredoxin oxidoreductase
VRAAETVKMPGTTALTEAVARYHFKLLAVKDEYEVARLYAESDFAERVAATFEGDYRLVFHLAPPLVAKPGALQTRMELASSESSVVSALTSY